LHVEKTLRSTTRLLITLLDLRLKTYWIHERAGTLNKMKSFSVDRFPQLVDITQQRILSVKKGTLLKLHTI
jgi:hypothetical protein